MAGASACMENIGALRGSSVHVNKKMARNVGAARTSVAGEMVRRTTHTIGASE